MFTIPSDMDWQRILEEIREEVEPLTRLGRVADYIPPLAEVPVEQFGMALRTTDGRLYRTGDADVPFSIQSVAKVFLLTVAMRYEGDEIWKRVGREPSGNPFHSLVLLERENGVPRNPFINAGAMVVTDIVLSHMPPGTDPLLELVRAAAGGEEAVYDERVARSEAETGHRNRALAHFLKSYGNLRLEVDAVLDAYFRLCSISMSCTGLAKAFAYLADGGKSASGEPLATPRQAKRMNALMLTSGVYDEAGDFAYRVGLPAKSGVGGGIAAVLPHAFSVAVWSPGLDRSGNSLAGTMALELLTTKCGLSVF